MSINSFHGNKDDRSEVMWQLAIESSRSMHRMSPTGLQIATVDTDKDNCFNNGNIVVFFFQAEDGIRDIGVTGVQTCALPILAVDEHVAQREVLRHAHERVVDRRVAMGVVVAHDLADDLGALRVGPRRAEAQLVHAVQDAAVDGLEAVAHVGQRAPDDDRHRVVEIRRAHLVLERAGLDVSASDDVSGHAFSPPGRSWGGRWDQTSRLVTRRALSSMNSRRGSTWSPMSIEKMRSASAASSTFTRASVRVDGFIVVSASWSAFISPSPLKRWTLTPLRQTSSTSVRSASNDSASRFSSLNATENGGVPASSASWWCTRRNWRYSVASNSERRRWCVRARPVRTSTARTTISSSSWLTTRVSLCPPSTPSLSSRASAPVALATFF